MGLPPRLHSCSHLAEVRPGPGGGQSGGGRAPGAAPSFLAPLRRRSRQREEPSVCEAELLACSFRGRRPTQKRGAVAVLHAWPAPPLQLACPPQAGPQRRSWAALPECPTPVLTAHASGLRARASSGRTTSTVSLRSAGSTDQLQKPQPLDRLAPARKGPFSRRPGPSPGPNTAAGAWPRAPEHEQSRRWAGHS